MGVINPDITICNHFGFDRIKLKRLDAIVADFLETSNRTVQWEVDLPDNLNDDVFVKALSRRFAKYQIFINQYMFNSELKINSSYS